MHPDKTAHGGSAILIKENIRHHEIGPYCSEETQATNIVVDDWRGQIVISAIYSPPKHNISKDKYINFFSTLDNRFVAGGDYNAKHTGDLEPSLPKAASYYK